MVVLWVCLPACTHLLFGLLHDAEELLHIVLYFGRVRVSQRRKAMALIWRPAGKGGEAGREISQHEVARLGSMRERCHQPVRLVRQKTPPFRLKEDSGAAKVDGIPSSTRSQNVCSLTYFPFTYTSRRLQFTCTLRRLVHYNEILQFSVTNFQMFASGNWRKYRSCCQLVPQGWF